MTEEEVVEAAREGEEATVEKMQRPSPCARPRSQRRARAAPARELAASRDSDTRTALEEAVLRPHSDEGKQLLNRARHAYTLREHRGESRCGDRRGGHNWATHWATARSRTAMHSTAVAARRSHSKTNACLALSRGLCVWPKVLARALSSSESSHLRCTRAPEGTAVAVLQSYLSVSNSLGGQERTLSVQCQRAVFDRPTADRPVSTATSTKLRTHVLVQTSMRCAK